MLVLLLKIPTLKVWAKPFLDSERWCLKLNWVMIGSFAPVGGVTVTVTRKEWLIEPLAAVTLTL